MRGVARALQGDLPGAVSDLDTALAQRPTDGDTAAASGLVADMEGREDDAVRLLSQALERGTSITPQVQTRLAAIYMARGDYGRALPLLEQARGARQEAPEAAMLYGLVLQALDRHGEALVELERVAAADGPFAGEAAVEMAASHLMQGNLPRAQEALRQAQQAGISSAKYHTLQGQVHLMNGQPAEAQRAFRQAIQMDPDYPAARLESGLLYVQREAIPEGIRELERYLELVEAAGPAARRNEIALLVDQLRLAADS